MSDIDVTMHPDDTIIAISSPPGGAVRGIVRLSGPDAFAIAAHVFTTADSENFDAKHPTCLRGHLSIEGGTLPAEAWLFPRPRSYTRQDTVEFHLIGSPIILGMLVEACLARGARGAQPGEFTARAFLAGALDLSQVHGVAGLIAARSDLQLAAAERLLHGSLADTAHAVREDLSDLLSLVEGAMDFADEPIEFIAPLALRERLGGVLAALETTLGAGFRAERWMNLPQVVLSGTPNAGKSSLLNRLTGIDRAICAPVAGTTRDVVSAPLSSGEFDCLLLDIAGLEEGRTELDRAAQAAADRARREADLVLHVLDASNGPTIDALLKVAKTDAPDSTARVWPPVNAAANTSSPESDMPTVPTIHVLNKIDLLDASARAALSKAVRRESAQRPVATVSTATGEGCAELARMIAEFLTDRPHDSRDPAIALMAEHRAALQSAIDALRRAIDLAAGSRDTLADADLVATELRLAADALGELVGKDQTEDLLGRIFSRFCVGK